jgi:signal transduction histidine kinase
VLRNSISYIKSAYQDRNIEIKYDCFSKRIFAQANELLQDVFDNILTNALKYNDNAKIDIFIKISRVQEQGLNYIQLDFIDNGIGITDERKKLVFERGHRESKGKKGMGLGLSLVKKIITSYKGKIWIENKIKEDYTKGSNFILLIPES